MQYCEGMNESVLAIWHHRKNMTIVMPDNWKDIYEPTSDLTWSCQKPYRYLQHHTCLASEKWQASRRHAEWIATEAVVHVQVLGPVSLLHRGRKKLKLSMWRNAHLRQYSSMIQSFSWCLSIHLVFTSKTFRSSCMSVNLCREAKMFIFLSIIPMDVWFIHPFLGKVTHMKTE